MLKDEVGKMIPRSTGERFNQQDDAVRNAIRVLVVDPVLGSRFSLIQAASQSGFLVDATASAEEARIQLRCEEYSVVIADDAPPEGAGMDLLVELRESHPDLIRVLVTSEKGLGAKRQLIERAGLSLLLTKPFSADSLRRNLRELLSTDSDFSTWTHLTSPPVRPVPRTLADDMGPLRHHEMVLRGLLAGLNSCETDGEVFELLHAELAAALFVDRWLWHDEVTGRVTYVAGDWPMNESLTFEKVSVTDRNRVMQAQRSARVTRLGPVEGSVESGASEGLAFLSLTIRVGGIRLKTCVVGLDRCSASSAASLLRELQGGLEMVFERIREADRRAATARNLARRVSEELRMPMGALTHAIDRLRGEAERAGLSAEWVDQVSSESERVVRAVEHLEGEMLAVPMRMLTTTN